MLTVNIRFILIIFLWSLFIKTGIAQKSSKEEFSFQLQLEEYNDKEKINLLIIKATELKDKNISKSIIYYKFALKLSESHNYLDEALYITYELADIFKEKKSHHYALKYYIKYEKLASSLNDVKNTGISNYYQANIFFLQNNFKKAEYHYIKASKLFLKIKDYTDLGCCYNSLGLLYDKSDLNKSFKYYEKAFHLELKYGTVPKCALYLNNMACIQIYKGELEQAKVKLDSAFSIAYKNNDLKTLSYIYSSFGEYYQNKQEFSQTEKAYLKSITLHQKLSNIEEIQKVSLQLSTLYEKENDYKLALHFYKQHIKILDSINKTIDYQLFQKQEFEQNLRQLEYKNTVNILNQNRKNLYYKILLIAIFTSSIFMLIILLFKKKLEVKRVKLSKENKTLKEELLLEKIENKNKELTSKAILLSERNDLIKNVSEKLNSCKPKLKQSNVKIIQNVINDLNSNINKKQWDDFQKNFNNLHPTFYKKLLNDSPTLSPRELKLCSFLKLNMSSKEIASITHISPNSVEVSRSRLRKKLNLSNLHISLFVFLSKY